MVSTVKSRPNHYEALGLKPTASEDEIARAFAKQMSLFRPMADSAQIGIAFETLRNPDKRRAYDEALGLRPQPQPRNAPTAVSFRTSARFNDPAPRPAMLRLADDPLRGRAPPVNPPARPDEPADNRAGAFIAASLRPPADAEPRRAAPLLPPQPQRQPRPQADMERIVRTKIGDPSPSDRLRPGTMVEAEDRPFGWSRGGAMVGGLVLAVALMGAWAGTQVGNAGEAQPAKRAASIALPPAEGQSEATSALPAPMPIAIEARPERPGRAVVAAPGIARDASPQQPARSDQPQGVASQSVGIGQSDVAVAENTIEQPAAEAPRTAAAAANLPLPNAVIARTIERIGYSCGRIGSTAAVEGGTPGAFKVTCTSGQTYRATLVGGRYRFRRVNGQ